MNTIPIPQDLHKQLVQELHKKDRLNRCLRNEIKSLHRKLKDSNRGAERNAWIAHDLTKELVEYKIKHPEPYLKKIDAEFIGTAMPPMDTAIKSKITVTKL